MDRISFTVNGEPHSVGPEISSDVTLLDYIRNYLELRGTKYMCREGGCGACVVSAVKSPGEPHTAVNSCLVSVTSCKDWDITTIEEVGNRLDGYNIIQKTLAKENGTQCGYCSPGWIMSMYSLLKIKPKITMLEIEKSLAGNTCRCTGYRPILAAFKKFGSDAPMANKIMDIEDLHICKKTGKTCPKKVAKDFEDNDWCVIDKEELKVGVTEINLKDGRKWFRVNSLPETLHLLANIKETHSYMLVNGNTAKGVYPITVYPEVLIDISGVQELKGYYLDQNLVVGAGNTLTEFMDILKTNCEDDYFGYLQKLHDHLELVAHIPVRNIGSIGGNLIIKNLYPDFQSDVFLLLETVGAEATIVDISGIKQSLPMRTFLAENMSGKILVNVLLPPLSDFYKLVTFKVTPRAQNAVAIVNAGFLYKLDLSNKVLLCRIVYGGLSSTFNRALTTETFLYGRDLFKNETLQGALTILSHELIVTENPPEPSAEYRQQLALALFYKGLLRLCPNATIHARYRTGAINLRETRPVSTGKQVYDTDPALYPINQPIPKVEALIQCSGEAPYTDDIPALPHEVFAEQVLATVPTGKIVSIDFTVALSIPGVIDFYTVKDIPGLNSFIPKDQLLCSADEEIFCDGTVKYFNQPIGVIVAATAHIAVIASKLVHIKYANVKPPVLEMNIAKKDPTRTSLNNSISATNPGVDIKKTFKGNNAVYGQYHYAMESLVTVAKPTEEGLEIHAATQWMNGVQIMTSRALLMDENKIDVHVRRLGGAYGVKISRSTQVAVVCALVTKKLNRPCRMALPMTTLTRAFGKRLPCLAEFEVGVNEKGKIQYINHNVYSDSGWKTTETLIDLGNDAFFNCYDKTKWDYKVYNVLTDTPKNTWCRSPGTLETIAMAEYVMERIATETSQDPLEVRLANLDDTQYSDLREMVATIKKNADYDARKVVVEKYNHENRWKKRGLRFSLLRWTPVGAQTLDVNLSVFSEDGSVSIIHGAIEMGQGVNTKAVQVAASILNIPIEKIQIKANNTNIAPNGFISGGSLTSQNVATGVQRCCDQLQERLAPLRLSLGNPTWEVLVKAAYRENIDLQTHAYLNNTDLQTYNVFGVALAEVEVDILTGESEVLRVDILQDVGQSISPNIDIGQVEGAFVMGLGYWTCEELVYEKLTGELLTDRSWNYKVPLARDIPQDFRIYFRKNSYSDVKIFGAKATGEPPMCLAVVVPFALREAITSARLEKGIPANKWFDIHGPYTIEKVRLAMKTDITDYKFY